MFVNNYTNLGLCLMGCMIKQEVCLKWAWQYRHVCVHAQLCPTLCDIMDDSPPGSSVHSIRQARILEWVAIPFSRGSSWPRDRTWVSHNAGRFFSHLNHPGSQHHQHTSSPAPVWASSSLVFSAWNPFPSHFCLWKACLSLKALHF